MNQIKIVAVGLCGQDDSLVIINSSKKLAKR